MKLDAKSTALTEPCWTLAAEKIKQVFIRGGNKLFQVEQKDSSLPSELLSLKPF